MTMTHKTLIVAGLIGLTGLTAGAFYTNRGEAPPEVIAELITRGAIVSTVAATATLEAVTTVQVGSQVSGSIQALFADFNSIVRKGQVLARLDPSLVESAIEQARANLLRTEADLERLEVSVADARVKRDRARELSARQLIPATELDTAEVNLRSAEAQARSAQAQVTQSRASLRQTQVNLEKTVIASPIDGIVIARNVDVGQTVAASLQAPTLFVIAADLSQMQLKANIDEADLGRIAEGQTVRFTVDAYPAMTFTGTVRQVRLNPVIEQNVVTYAAIISAQNPELMLKPGMTASVTVEVARRDDVLRVPNAALRFRPSDALRRALDAGDAPAKPHSVWTYAEGRLTAIAVTTGATDGTHTEIVDAPLQEGTRVVTRATAGGAAAEQPRVSASPLMPSGPRR